MRRALAFSTLSAIALAVGSQSASAVPLLGSAWVSVDGEQFNIPISQAADGTLEIGGETGWQHTASGGDFISIGGVIDPDPQIDFGFSVTDFGAPSTFTFSFSSPITLGAGPTVVFASLSGGLNDVTSNGASVTPALPDTDLDGILEMMASSVDNGGPLTNMGVDVGQQMVLPPGTSGTQTYGPYNAGPQAGPPGPWGNLSSTVKFTGSGGGDIFSATGHAEINNGVVAPEPTAFGLLGLEGLGVVRRRRR
jgi:MYXO-CTERM domain-containing protein